MKAANYIIDVMEGRKVFPDALEKNDRWATEVRLFLASTLSLIIPDQPGLDADRALWLEIARRAFQSGAYREDDEIKAHAELTGATVKGSYLVLRGKYHGTLARGAAPPLSSHYLKIGRLGRSVSSIGRPGY